MVHFFASICDKFDLEIKDIEDGSGESVFCFGKEGTLASALADENYRIFGRGLKSKSWDIKMTKKSKKNTNGTNGRMARIKSD